jgi:hypothetical protein
MATKSSEQIRIKVYDNKLVIGIMGRDTFNGTGRYFLFDFDNNAESTAKAIANTFGFFTIRKSFVDGIGAIHTQVWTRK